MMIFIIKSYNNKHLMYQNNYLNCFDKIYFKNEISNDISKEI